ncbi:hypothetical protein [Actinomycetospora soli]|uniref:hypothetical protein n=1 Tax=Actinomycetospora soli TaxID=2893887 RepID=UPI001E596D80|nr:hypothetical protein [Actinomycetospora soli]MCD2190188.1 hypothetical protein [Actinomycetospora soli]
MSSGRVRVPVPGAVVGVVIALCAVLLLKWLAIVALVGWGLTLLVRWAWRRHRGTPAPPLDAGLDLLLPAPRAEQGPAPASEDCTWCGLVGGHRDLRGRLVRPRHAHAA